MNCADARVADLRHGRLCEQALEQGAKEGPTYEAQQRQAEADSELLAKLLHKQAVLHQVGHSLTCDASHAIKQCCATQT